MKNHIFQGACFVIQSHGIQSDIVFAANYLFEKDLLE